MPFVLAILSWPKYCRVSESDKDYRLAQEILLELPLYQIMTPELALMGADNYRPLRKKGFTVRKSVDNWIATFRISTLTSDLGTICFPRLHYLRTTHVIKAVPRALTILVTACQ